MRDSPNKLSLTEAVVAQLLQESPTPLFGLEMVRRSPPGELQLKKGTIYVTLERMDKKGLVTSKLETTRPPHLKPDDFYIPRRMYWLTEQGSAALEATKEVLAQYHGFLVRS